MMELPSVLTNLINHLLNTYGGVKSWNIFESDKGTVNVNIRFPNITSDCLVGHVEPVSYRRVPTRQAERSKHRAEAYRSKQLTHSSNEQNSRNAHTQTEHTTTEKDINKKRKLDISSPEIHRNEDTITTDNHDIDTPIKVQDFKVEYQVHKHDDSFSSCTSEVNNAQDYESASLQVPDLMSQHEPQPEIQICDDLSVNNHTQAKFETGTTESEKIVCPCCENIMTPTHICEIEPLSAPNNADEPLSPPPTEYVPCPPELMKANTAEGMDYILNDPDFGERFNAYLNSESCKNQ